MIKSFMKNTHTTTKTTNKRFKIEPFIDSNGETAWKLFEWRVVVGLGAYEWLSTHETEQQAIDHMVDVKRKPQAKYYD